MKIPLMKSTFLGEQETKDALCSFIQNSQKMSMGEEVSQFEVLFSSWQQRKYTTMVNSGSSANLLVIQALINLGRLVRGDRVGISAVTWATNVMPVIQLGLVPVLIDVNSSTLNVSCEEVSKHDIRCLFITHLLGFHGDIDAIASYCKDKNIVLLEDTCESLGTRCGDRRLGNFGLASTFSSFVGHHMSTIEGGLVCTDDPELDMMIRMTRAHGWDRNVTAEQRRDLRSRWNITDFQGPYTFYALGYNVRPMDLQGLIGTIQLKYIDESNKRRTESYRRIREAIVSKQLESPDQVVPAFAIPVICPDTKTRNLYVERCRTMGIETRPVVAGNINRQPFFVSYLATTPLPVADHIHDCGFYLPNHPDLTEEELAYLTSVFT